MQAVKEIKKIKKDIKFRKLKNQNVHVKINSIKKNYGYKKDYSN